MITNIVREFDRHTGLLVQRAVSSNAEKGEEQESFIVHVNMEGEVVAVDTKLLQSRWITAH